MRLGIIGCGKMGSALLAGVLKSGVCKPESVVVHDAVAAAQEAVSTSYGVASAASNSEVLAASDAVLLCIKPQTFPALLEEIRQWEGPPRLLISIAAGIRIAAIENGSGNRHRVIRVMPNTPAMVQRGASAFARGSTATAEDALLTGTLLESVGFVTEVTEPQLDAVTALSGSGPAYIFFLIESLVKGGQDVGLDETTALHLSAHTVAGAAELLLSTRETPAKLRENVTSPGGTTFAALESLRSDHFDDIVRRAMGAAHRRSLELGDQ